MKESLDLGKKINILGFTRAGQKKKKKKKKKRHVSSNWLSVFAQMWHKAEWMGNPVKLELTREGLLV